ncbi:MAG TPA: hypothetical protein VH022_01365, partial [Candidatus Acidoferrum sp.]|nr:hypothetical protein [Candidatus Acidoferrum sp.]
MFISRRNFHRALGITALTGISSPFPMEAGSAKSQSDPKNNSHYLFDDKTFETIFLTRLGRAYSSGANVGKVLYLSRKVTNGD